MAKRAQVTCIIKKQRNDPYEQITHIGGVAPEPWKISLVDAIYHIEELDWEFYCVGPDDQESSLVVRISPTGCKYLKTEADSDTPDSLLRLPQCP